MRSLSTARSPSPARAPLRSQDGFTLLEAVVALGILGTGVAVALGVLATGTAASHRVETRVLAVELAQDRMEAALLQDAFGRGRAGGAEQRFEAPYDDFRWRTRISPGSIPGTELVEVVVLGAGDSVHLATLRRR